jgi:hypothetical protein
MGVYWLKMLHPPPKLELSEKYANSAKTYGRGDKHDAVEYQRGQHVRTGSIPEAVSLDAEAAGRTSVSLTREALGAPEALEGLEAPCIRVISTQIGTSCVRGAINEVISNGTAGPYKSSLTTDPPDEIRTDRPI